MKKASKILFGISAGLSIFYTVLFAIFAFVFLFYSLPGQKDAIIQGLQDGTITSTFSGTTEEVATAIQLMFSFMSIVFFFEVVFAIINTIIAFLALKKDKRIFSILSIVFGAISGIVTSIVGGILSLVAERNNPEF